MRPSHMTVVPAGPAVAAPPDEVVRHDGTAQVQDAAPARSRTVTSRALTVFEAFDGEHRRLTLSQISRRSGLPLATAHRLVADLVEWQALERDADGAYQIGARLWALAALCPLESRLRDAGSATMADLFAVSGENVHLGIRDGGEALFIHKIGGRRSVPIVSGVGARLPLHATGVGKVLLAWAPDDIVDQTLRNLARVTPYTITEPIRLRRDLTSVRERGWAVTVEEMTLGCWSVAAPVRVDGEVLAAIGLVGHSSRRDLKRFVPALLEAARDIQVRLSGRPPAPQPALRRA